MLIQQSSLLKTNFLHLFAIKQCHFLMEYSHIHIQIVDKANFVEHTKTTDVWILILECKSLPTPSVTPLTWHYKHAHIWLRNVYIAILPFNPMSTVYMSI